MRVLVKYKNGATRELPLLDGQPVPPSFRIREPEGCTFHFKLVDELPSGVLYYVETTRKEAQAIWRDE